MNGSKCCVYCTIESNDKSQDWKKSTFLAKFGLLKKKKKKLFLLCFFSLFFIKNKTQTMIIKYIKDSILNESFESLLIKSIMKCNRI